jgi:hypothetical protein
MQLRHRLLLTRDFELLRALRRGVPECWHQFAPKCCFLEAQGRYKFAYKTCPFVLFGGSPGVQLQPFKIADQ